MATDNDELEQFKTEINLCDYAEFQGFVLDRKQSSKASAVMRHPCGDKIVIAKKHSGHWIYFNVHGSDCGSILDFVGSRKSISLGLVRKELRPWVRGGGRPTHELSLGRNTSNDYDLVPVTQNIADASCGWAKGRSLIADDTYLQSRGIGDAVVNDPVFGDRVRIDERRNCLFPHWNALGVLSGFEIKNRGFTGFMPGGEKGLWCSRPRLDDSTMVVCESAIDAMSVAELFGTDEKRFFSTAGTCSPNQIASLISAVNRMPENPCVWLAFDNDESGKKMAGKLHSILKQEVCVDLNIEIKTPMNEGQDWNDVLQSKPKTVLSNRQNNGTIPSL